MKLDFSDYGITMATVIPLLTAIIHPVRNKNILTGQGDLLTENRRNRLFSISVINVIPDLYKVT